MKYYNIYYMYMIFINYNYDYKRCYFIIRSSSLYIFHRLIVSSRFDSKTWNRKPKEASL